MGKVPLPLSHLRYNGLFDFDGAYAAIIDWAKNYGYLWHEEVYKHKVPSPAGAEQEFIWELSKNVNAYIKYIIKIKAKVYDMTEVKVNIKGKEQSLSNGRVKMAFQGTVEYDWQKRFSGGGKWAQWLGELYAKLYWKDIDNVYADPLMYRVLNLHNIVKKYFDMQTKKYGYKGYLRED